MRQLMPSTINTHRQRYFFPPIAQKPYLSRHYASRSPRAQAIDSLGASPSPSPSALAQAAFTTLARRSKSWARLRHVVDFAVEGDCGTSLVDVGTDHGLLACGLAVTGRFERVLGVDVSEAALRDGAIKLRERFEACLEGSRGYASLEFRIGDGLKGLRKGEAGVVCVAGMGCKTMVDILTERSADGFLLDEIGCTRLALQPAGSKPRDLVLLYDALKLAGWKVRDEKIEFIASRWYLSLSFQRGECCTRDSVELFRVPGGILSAEVDVDDELQRVVFDNWVSHHCDWIQRDMKRTGDICREEHRWLEVFGQRLNRLM